MSSRTPLFAALRRAVQIAGLSERRELPPLDELVELSRRPVDRRAFLRGLAGGAAVGLVAACGASPAAAGARVLGGAAVAAGARGGRVAIVGAGFAGLAAAHALSRAGVPYTLYEGSDRVGGRVRSARGLFGPGLTTELGAEFIDSSHKRLLGLVRELGLPLLDGDDAPDLADAYVFGGKHYTDRQLAEAVKPFLPRLRRDQESLPDSISYHQPGSWTALDRISLADYLDDLGMRGWLRSLIESAYLTEFGLEMGEQSALNLVGLVGTQLVNGQFNMIGESDERYKIVGGNQRLAEALATAHADHLRLGHKLEAIAPAGSGYRLSFARTQGPAVQVEVDCLIIALPFNLLRDVQITVPLPPAKRRAIDELAYGQNAKLMLGFQRRVWQEARLGGFFVSDGELPNGWENTFMQGGQAAALTLYMGGRLGQEVGQGSPEAQAERRLPALERVFAGSRAAYTGQAERFHWPSSPWARGSYACYTVGQASAFRGAEGEPVGRLFFAGEHCADANQGFMDGAVETGQRAAAAVVKALGARV